MRNTNKMNIQEKGLLNTNPNLNDSTKIEFIQIKECFDSLIKLNQDLRNQLCFDKQKQDDWIGKENYYKEYATIKLDIGRQTGKTTYIKEHLNDDNSIVFVSANRIKDFTYKNYKDKCFIINNLNPLIDINLSNIEYVFIDDASWWDYDLVY